jgi:hypothetical protein
MKRKSKRQNGLFLRITHFTHPSCRDLHHVQLCQRDGDAFHGLLSGTVTAQVADLIRNSGIAVEADVEVPYAFSDDSLEQSLAFSRLVLIADTKGLANK